MIRRSQPLKRVGLNPPTPEQRAAWSSRPRKPIGRNVQPARVGRKAKREEAAWQLCKAIVLARSGGYCEANIVGVCPRWKHGGTQTHHLHPQDRDKGLHDPARCIRVCSFAHPGWIHGNPKEAKKLGLLRPDPVVVPDEPLWPEVVC